MDKITENNTQRKNIQTIKRHEEQHEITLKKCQEEEEIEFVNHEQRKAFTEGSPIIPGAFLKRALLKMPPCKQMVSTTSALEKRANFQTDRV